MMVREALSDGVVVREALSDGVMVREAVPDGAMVREAVPDGAISGQTSLSAYLRTQVHTYVQFTTK